MRTIALMLYVALGALSIAARTVIKGVVSDPVGAPVAKAIVKAETGKSIKAFANTKADGTFSLVIDADADSLAITVDKLSCEKCVLRVPNANQTLSLTLLPEAKQLREVVVSAPAVYQRGDTLRFNLAQFLGKGDVSLEDALKKVPGISVAENGKISYMGKDISNFYIEGLEMLGGNYNLATRNLPAEHVSGVEVLSNHNEAKMDKGKLSDNVALNVRLKKTALLRPVGTSEASAGVSHRKFLYALGATGLLFTPKMQATVSAKIGNIREFSQTLSGPVTVRGAGGGNPQSSAESAIGSLSAGSPPIDGNRYRHIADRMASVNAISKLGKESTLRVNASYAYHKQSNSSSSSKSYYIGNDQWLTVNSESFVCGRSHKPALSAQYTLNSDRRYVCNDFTAIGDFHEIDMPVVADGTPIAQDEKYDNFKIADAVYFRFRTGRLEWRSITDASFERTPSLTLKIGGAEGETMQDAKSSTLQAAQRLGTLLYAGPSQWGLEFALDYRHDAVSTHLARSEKPSDNDMSGHVMQCAASPSYQFTTIDKRLQLDVAVDLKSVMIKGENCAGDAARLRFSRLYADPKVKLRYTASSVSKWTFSTGLSHHHGNLLTLLTNEVVHDYRSESVKSGVLARNASYSVSGRYEFREPIELWFASVSADCSMVKQNLMHGQYITDASSSTSTLASDNRRREFRVSGSVSKGVQSIKSKFSLSSAYSWNHGMVMQQGVPTACHSTNGYVDASANVRPASWLEADLGARISVTGSRFAGMRNDFHSLDGHLRLSVFPIGNLELKSNVDYYSRQLSDNRYKRMALWDFNATYKIKSLRIRLSLNNLLNQKRYSYIMYSGLDTYKYDYALRGREVILSLIFTK